MPARETEAIILKTFPLGEADRLVSFLGRTSGRLRGVAGGARRVKNRYGSTLEVLSHVQIWYVEKETRELVRIQPHAHDATGHVVDTIGIVTTYDGEPLARAVVRSSPRTNPI